MAPPDVLTDTPPRVLALYAHPDDPEVSCGGTLARWARDGAHVHLVIAARGEKGSRDPAADPDELAARRETEIREAAEVLGIAELELLGHPDGELDAVAGLRAQLVEVLRRVRPDTVLCPDPTAVFFGDGYVNHVDHRALGWAALDAMAPAASSPLYFPYAGPPHQVSTVLLSGTLEPDVWVDVAATIDTKVDALFRHRSQVGDDADWLRTFVQRRAEEAGEQAGMAAAEAFRRIRLSAG